MVEPGLPITVFRWGAADSSFVGYCLPRDVPSRSSLPDARTIQVAGKRVPPDVVTASSERIVGYSDNIRAVS
jgi:hypothetical protein